MQSVSEEMRIRASELNNERSLGVFRNILNARKRVWSVIFITGENVRRYTQGVSRLGLRMKCSRDNYIVRRDNARNQIGQNMFLLSRIAEHKTCFGDGFNLIKQVSKVGLCAVTEYLEDDVRRRFVFGDKKSFKAFEEYLGACPVIEKSDGEGVKKCPILHEVDLVVTDVEFGDSEIREKIAQWPNRVKAVIRVKEIEDLGFVSDSDIEFLRENKNLLRSIEVEVDISPENEDKIRETLADFDSRLNADAQRQGVRIELKFVVQCYLDLMKLKWEEFGKIRVREIVLKRGGLMANSELGEGPKILRNIDRLDVLNFSRGFRIITGTFFVLPNSVRKFYIDTVEGSLKLEKDSECRFLEIDRVSGMGEVDVEGKVSRLNITHSVSGKLNLVNAFSLKHLKIKEITSRATVCVPRSVEFFEAESVTGRFEFEEGSSCKKMKLGMVEVKGRKLIVPCSVKYFEARSVFSQSGTLGYLSNDVELLAFEENSECEYISINEIGSLNGVYLPESVKKFVTKKAEGQVVVEGCSELDEFVIGEAVYRDESLKDLIAKGPLLTLSRLGE